MCLRSIIFCFLSNFSNISSTAWNKVHNLENLFTALKHSKGLENSKKGGVTTELYPHVGSKAILASDATRIISRSLLHVQSSSWLFVEKFEPSLRKLSSSNVWHLPRTPGNLHSCGLGWWNKKEQNNYKKWTDILGEAADDGEPWRIRRFLWKSSCLKLGSSLRCMSQKAPEENSLMILLAWCATLVLGNIIGHIWCDLTQKITIMKVSWKNPLSPRKKSDSERPYFPMRTLSFFKGPRFLLSRVSRETLNKFPDHSLTIKHNNKKLTPLHRENIHIAQNRDTFKCLDVHESVHAPTEKVTA